MYRPQGLAPTSPAGLTADVQSILYQLTDEMGIAAFDLLVARGRAPSSTSPAGELELAGDFHLGVLS